MHFFKINNNIKYENFKKSKIKINFNKNLKIFYLNFFQLNL